MFEEKETTTIIDPIHMFFNIIAPCKGNKLVCAQCQNQDIKGGGGGGLS